MWEYRTEQITAKGWNGQKFDNENLAAILNSFGRENRGLVSFTTSNQWGSSAVAIAIFKRPVRSFRS